MPYFPVVPLAKSPSRMAAAALLSSPLFVSPSSSASGISINLRNQATCLPASFFSSPSSSCGCRSLCSEFWGPERYLGERRRKTSDSETVLSLRIRAPTISQQQLSRGSALAWASASAPIASSSSSSSWRFGGSSSRDTGALNFGINSNRRSPMTSTTANASPATAPASAQSLHEFTVKDINGEEIDLSKFKGKVLLVVNVASACGLTSGNYAELAEVYGELKDSGLEILAFPCNQFGGQEPGSNEQIKEFACTRYKAEFPIFDKVEVNGPNTAPVYQFLKAKKGGGILGSSIKWNFAKFLVDQNGFVVERYAPTTSPKKIVGDIKKLIGTPPATGATASA